MNFTNTDCVKEEVEINQNLGYSKVNEQVEINQNLGYSKVNEQVEKQVFWQVFYQFNPILHKITQEIKK